MTSPSFRAFVMSEVLEVRDDEIPLRKWSGGIENLRNIECQT